MKLKLGVICGFLLWIVSLIALIIINPIFIRINPEYNILQEILIYIIITIFGVLYIRQNNENGAKEGLKVGIIFLIINVICDLILINIIDPNIIILNNYKLHLILQTIGTLFITTILGYLSEMEIRLK